VLTTIIGLVKSDELWMWLFFGSIGLVVLAFWQFSTMLGDDLFPHSRDEMAAQLERWNNRLASCLNRYGFPHPFHGGPRPDTPDQVARDCYYEEPRTQLIELLRHSDRQGWTTEDEWIAVCDHPQTPDEIWAVHSFVRDRFIKPWRDQGDRVEPPSWVPDKPQSRDEWRERLGDWNQRYWECLDAIVPHPEEKKTSEFVKRLRFRKARRCWYGKSDELGFLMNVGKSQRWISESEFRGSFISPQSIDDLWRNGYAVSKLVQGEQIEWDRLLPWERGREP
jgi:hypothetical protein